MTVQLNLSKNTPSLNLTKIAPGLKKVRGELKWTPSPLLKQEFDLDIFTFTLEKGKIIDVPGDVVFFNNKQAYDGAIVYPRDSRDGGDVEEVFYTLDKVPARKDSIEIFVFIHEAAERGQDFSMMSNATFDLINDDTGLVLQSYKLQSFVNGYAVHVGTLARITDGFEFKPVGESAQADPNQVLSAFL